MSYRFRSRLVLGSLAAVAAGSFAWQQESAAQQRDVPPTQAPAALAPTEPVQALPKPKGQPVITDQLPNQAIQLWSFTPEVPPRVQYTPADLAAKLLQAPISHNFPGGVAITPGIENPYGKDPDAAKRGMQHFIAFNCVGCHAPDGGGGMGPSLSDQKWRFGSEAPNIFLTIVQGRSTGMPAFGGMLPDKAIWELVSYVQSIAEKPSHPHEGLTVSRSPLSPSIQQVPAEIVLSDNPWAYVEPFSSGQKPQMRLSAASATPGANGTAAASGAIPEAPVALPGAPPPLYPPERIPQVPAEQSAANAPPGSAPPGSPPPGSPPPGNTPAQNTPPGNAGVGNRAPEPAAAKNLHPTSEPEANKK